MHACTLPTAVPYNAPRLLLFEFSTQLTNEVVLSHLVIPVFLPFVVFPSIQFPVPGCAIHYYIIQSTQHNTKAMSSVSPAYFGLLIVASRHLAGGKHETMVDVCSALNSLFISRTAPVPETNTHSLAHIHSQKLCGGAATGFGHIAACKYSSQCASVPVCLSVHSSLTHLLPQTLQTRRLPQACPSSWPQARRLTRSALLLMKVYWT
jgi:hypothetical protein